MYSYAVATQKSSFTEWATGRPTGWPTFVEDAPRCIGGVVREAKCCGWQCGSNFTAWDSSSGRSLVRGVRRKVEARSMASRKQEKVTKAWGKGRGSQRGIITRVQPCEWHQHKVESLCPNKWFLAGCNEDRRSFSTEQCIAEGVPLLCLFMPTFQHYVRQGSFLPPLFAPQPCTFLHSPAFAALLTLTRIHKP